MVIGGLFDARRTSDVLEDVFEATIAMRDEVAAFRDETDLDVKVRIGVHVGPVIEGILGVLRPRYHVFGLTVLDAAEAESSGKPGEIHLTKAAAEAYGHRKFDLQRDENEEVYLQADSVDAVIEEDAHFITELRHG